MSKGIAVLRAISSRALGCLAVPKARLQSGGPDLMISKDTSNSISTWAAGTLVAGGSCSPSAPRSPPAHLGKGSHSPLPRQVRHLLPDCPVPSSCHKQVILLTECKPFYFLVGSPLSPLGGAPMASHPLLLLETSPCSFLSFICRSTWVALRLYPGKTWKPPSVRQLGSLSPCGTNHLSRNQHYDPESLHSPLFNLEVVNSPPFYHLNVFLLPCPKDILILSDSY